MDGFNFVSQDHGDQPGDQRLKAGDSLLDSGQSGVLGGTLCELCIICVNNRTGFHLSRLEVSAKNLPDGLLVSVSWLKYVLNKHDSASVEGGGGFRDGAACLLSCHVCSAIPVGGAHV